MYTTVKEKRTIMPVFTYFKHTEKFSAIRRSCEGGIGGSILYHSSWNKATRLTISIIFNR